ncbi:MAG: hypothetical protein SVU32_07855 [Candidatus Nanohaloarchaea archaeon]|nr:hypothetical protein [Candidatus Nanohaloarchaea archaeon]
MMYVSAVDYGAGEQQLTAAELEEYGWSADKAAQLVDGLGWGETGVDPDWYEDARDRATYRDHIEDAIYVRFDDEGGLDSVVHEVDAGWMEDELLRLESERPLAYLEQAVVAPDPDMSWKMMRQRLEELYEKGCSEMKGDSGRSAGP